MFREEEFIDEFSNEIDDVTNSDGILDDTGAAPDNANFDKDPFGEGDPRGGGDGLVQDGNAFLDNQRLPYGASGNLTSQIGSGSCIAACCRRKHSASGVEEPEACVREVANVSPNNEEELFGASAELTGYNFGAAGHQWPPANAGMYNPIGLVFEQGDTATCNAACGRMVLSDNSVTALESDVIQQANIDPRKGGLLRDLPNALNNLDSVNRYDFSDNMFAGDLESELENGPVIVSVQADPASGWHSVVIDGIDENNQILIRDPAPSVGAYSLSWETFMDIWTHEAVFLLGGK